MARLLMTQDRSDNDGVQNMNGFLRFLKDESGATAIEYGLIAAAISIVMIAFLPTISDNLNLVWSKVGSGLAKAAE
jgi:pilus assembly protein Flp/PilA